MQHKCFVHLTIILAACTLSACTKDNLTENNLEKGNPAGSTKNPFYALQSSDIIVSRTMGRYINAVNPSDYVINISSSKQDPLSERVYSYSHTVNSATIHSTRTAYQSYPPFSVRLNGIYLDSQARTRSSDVQSDLSGFFGHHAEFGFSLGQLPDTTMKTQSGFEKPLPPDWPGGPITPPGTDPPMYCDDSLPYIPREIAITIPAVHTPQDLYPLCFYKNFVIGWNADELNQQGLIVCIEWLGTMIYGKSLPGMFMRRTMFIEQDNGRAVLDEALFEGIPDTALCHLTITRGLTETVDVPGKEGVSYSYNIIAESHADLEVVWIFNGINN